MSNIDTFMVYGVDNSGEKVKIDIKEDDLQNNLHPEQVLVIVKEDLRRIFIWKGAKSPVRKKFISSRIAQTLQEELMKNARYLRCKILSVDAGDEPTEFLKAFQLKSMKVEDRLDSIPDLAFSMNEKIGKKKVNPEELILAEKLIDKCKLDEAEQLIRNFEEKRGHTLHDIVLCHLLKCELLFWRGLYEDVVRLAEQTYKESLGLGKNLLSVDILLKMAYALVWRGQSDNLQRTIMQGEKLLKALTQELPADYKQREAYIAYLKGWFYLRKKDADQALKHLEHSLELREELGSKQEIVFSLIGIASVFTFLKVDFDRALKYAELGMTIAKERGNKWIIGYYFMRIATIHKLRGELERSVKLYKQGLKIFNDLNNKFWVAVILNPLGEAYRQKGELDRALECLEQSLALFEESGNLITIASIHGYLIQTLIDKSDLELAQQSLHRFEQLNNQLKNKQVNILYLYYNALILKTSPRAINRGKAEEILKQILENEDLSFRFILKVLINLCELLLTELRMTNDLEVLDELTQFIDRLLDIAEKSHSYSILCETYLLEAKLSLLSFNIKKAKRFLTQAQQIAERFGLKLLAIKISNEHDELLKHLNMWENLKKSTSSLKERIEFARLNEKLENMIQKRVIEVPELSDEEPVLLLIITEGGRRLFSNSFSKDWDFEEDIVSSFLTAFNSFSEELFSEGLDRAKFGDYTILMESVINYYVCYLFKGQTYLAKQKLAKFSERIQNITSIWQLLEKYHKSSQVLEIKDSTPLKSLITDIFTKGSIEINV